MNPKSLTQAGVLSSVFREQMKSINTSIPGHVLVFDGNTQRAQIQVGVERIDVNGASFRLPPIIDVPVCFPGGQFCVEYEINPGDEGKIDFSQRCIDGWKQTGGVASNPIGRFFEMQDAFFTPGFRPLPAALPNFQNNGIRLRNKSGSQYAWLKNDGSIVMENGAGHIRLGADGTVTINGVTFDTSGNVTTAETMQAKLVRGTQDVNFGGKSGINHVHTNVENGPSNSGPPA